MKISSPVGDYDYRVQRIAWRDGRLEILGRLGEWETTAILEPSDLLNLLRKMAIPVILGGGLVAVTRGRRRV